MMSEHLLVSWGGETHFVNGGGLSSSVLLCSVSNRDDEVIATAPHRSKADELEFLSDDAATCTWCQKVAKELLA